MTSAWCQVSCQSQYFGESCLQAILTLSETLKMSIRLYVLLCKYSDLRQQLEEVAEQRSADAQQAQRESEISKRQLANAQQQLQFKADIIHQLTGGLQVSTKPFVLACLDLKLSQLLCRPMHLPILLCVLLTALLYHMPLCLYYCTTCLAVSRFLLHHMSCCCVLLCVLLLHIHGCISCCTKSVDV